MVEPILLGSKVFEKASDCNCCCCCDLPDKLVEVLDAPICFDDSHTNRFLTVSIGIFSVIRIVRPAQYLISAGEYAIPEKECVSVEEDDPCCVFRNMPFPGNEFTAQAAPGHPCDCHDKNDRPAGSGRCGC